MKEYINRKNSSWIIKCIIICVSVIWLLFVAGLSVYRYRANYSSTFDFGLFAQMYYYMDKIFLPMTTAERNMYLSHFAVHISPIFYLLLPVYMIFKSQTTILVCQALIVITGVIPLYKICNRLKLSNMATLAFCLIYCSYPAFIGGCFYDFHENAFLGVLLLWMIYFAESEKYKVSLLFCLLVCMVKEDAPIYAACVSLFFFTYRKKYAYGVKAFALSVAYFLAAVILLKIFGQGVMSGRFDNLIADDSMGIFGIAKTILVNPVYVILEVFKKEKLVFLMQMAMPLGLLPLMNKNWQKWILLIPMVLINLLPDYQYQHSIFFQYTFGGGALLFYLAIVNYSERKESVKGYGRILLMLGVCASMLISISTMGSKTRYLGIYNRNQEKIAAADELLETIPKDASVETTTFFMPKLAQRDEIYKFDELYSTDYLVVDLRKGMEDSGDEIIINAQIYGYEITGEVENYVVVMKKMN